MKTEDIIAKTLLNCLLAKGKKEPEDAVIERILNDIESFIGKEEFDICKRKILDVY